MKHYFIKAYETDISIFECLPSEGIPVLMQKEERQYIENFENKYFEDRGYELVEVSNCSLFGYVDNTGRRTNKSIPYGTAMRDKGYWINKPYINNWLVTMVYENGKYIVDDFADANKYPDAFLMFGGFPCVLNGKKDNRKWNKTAHLFSRTDRTIVGQKFDGTLIKIIADELTAEECSKFCLSLNVETAVIVDGGGSSQERIEDDPVNSNRRKVANALGFYAKKGYKLDREDSTVDLIIDPGHGGKDPGGGSNKYWTEKDKVLDISLYQYKRFE